MAELESHMVAPSALFATLSWWFCVFGCDVCAVVGPPKQHHRASKHLKPLLHISINVQETKCNTHQQQMLYTQQHPCNVICPVCYAVYAASLARPICALRAVILPPPPARARLLLHTLSFLLKKVPVRTETRTEHKEHPILLTHTHSRLQETTRTERCGVAVCVHATPRQRTTAGQNP